MTEIILQEADAPHDWFRSAALTGVGGRSRNEDAHGQTVVDDVGIWVVADGLGGHLNGDVASKLTVGGALDAFRERPECSEATVRYCLEVAASRVWAAGANQPPRAKMRSTIVLAIVKGDRIAWGHVGDSRLYWYRDRQLSYRTLDQSVAEKLRAAGMIDVDQVNSHPDRNLLLHSIGESSLYLEDIKSDSCAPGDALLLCSDGLWENLSNAELEETLRTSEAPSGWLEALDRIRVQRASKNCDNYTGLAIFLE